MSTFKYHQVECPKCHGKINSVDQLSGPMKCMYCGVDFQITGTMLQETDEPDGLVPFATSRNDFERAALEMLIDADYTPNNIIDIISLKNVRGFYLPAFLYEGRYECSWNCMVRQPEVGAPDTAPGGKYRPQSGVTKGNYSFVCLAFAGVEAPPELAEYVRTFDYDADAVKPFSSDSLNDYLFSLRNLDKKAVWIRQGESTLKNVAQKAAERQMSGSEFKDFKSAVTSEQSNDGRSVLIPVWTVFYEYDGEPHHVMMDGTGRNGVKGTTLVDRARIDEVEKPFKYLKFIAGFAILIPLVLLLLNQYLPAVIALAAMCLVFFGYRYYARLHKKKVVNKARKERMNMLQQTTGINR